MTKHSDSELIRLYRSDSNLTALEVLLQRYKHLIFCLCNKYLKNESDSEDACMEILENLIDILRIQNIRNFNTYLYSVIKNHCLKRLKRASRSGLVFKNPQEMASLAVDNSQNEDLLDKRNVDFEHLLNQLSEAQKYCIKRFYFEKKSYRQIADGNGYNLRQVKTHIQNGKKRLRTLIQREAEKT